MKKMPLHILRNITLERYVESRSLMMRGDPSYVEVGASSSFFRYEFKNEEAPCHWIAGYAVLKLGPPVPSFDMNLKTKNPLATG
jgi:hypothetical protein